MKKIIFFILLLVATPVYAGSLEVAVGLMPNGHSEGLTHRCVNSGGALGVSYNEEVFSYKFFGLHVAPAVIVSNYETAHRDKVTEPESKKRRETAFNTGVIVRPTISIGKLSGFYTIGVGGDWMENAGFDLAYRKGTGIAFDLDDKTRISFSLEKVIRRDGSFYKYCFLSLQWRF
ncbi:MAG: hypothetical protein JRJ29_00340 [Deltaproteobacteria bacterium]|nr:hypothetical protein [Deltaproteobacteria bacterium]MBW2081615.1 hypothetical protein [Deltaproteobacteria bacterium]